MSQFIQPFQFILKPFEACLAIQAIQAIQASQAIQAIQAFAI